MPKYLIQGNYVGEGIKGLLKEGGSGRKEAVEKLVSSMGGSVESMYYALGDTDVYVVVDMPDNASVSAIALVASATGAVTINTTVLLTPQEVDEAAKMTPDYRPPGQ
jgi:uncharacterized protein with GYD domain